MIRKNMKLIIGFIIGLLITTGGVYAANSLSASSISISKTNMSKVEQENLQSALDYLYDKSEKNNLITIESGVLHKSQTYLGIVYLDPTNLENKCTAQNSVSTTGTKTGCMKWYIYKDLGDSYKMILDHNTTASSIWNENLKNVPFSENTTGDSSNDNLSYIELMKLKSDYNWKVTPDIISADEVAEIVGYDGFTNTKDWFCLDTKQVDHTNYCAKAQGTSKYAWLFDNLGWSTESCTDYGCNMWDGVNSLGYWTKTTRGGDSSRIWHVNAHGTLYYLGATVGDYARRGLRPVITISKSLFQS